MTYNQVQIRAESSGGAVTKTFCMMGREKTSSLRVLRNYSTALSTEKKTAMQNCCVAIIIIIIIYSYFNRAMQTSGV